MNRLYSWLSRKTRRKPPVRLGDLPREIVLEIVHYLPELDHLCLALTCKSLWDLLANGALQRSSSFRDSSGLLPPSSSFYNDRTSRKKFRSNRWKLLQRLEDSYWRCCFGCFRLHPHYEFSAQDLQTAPSKRTCAYGPLVGVFRLCPCIAMTFRDKTKIVTRFLSSSQAECHRLYNHSLESLATAGQHRCSHSYESGCANVHITLKLIVEEDKNLVVETKYTITGTELPYCFNYNTILLCPHRDLQHHIFELELQHSMYGNRHGYWQYLDRNGKRWNFANNPMSCPWCEATSWAARWRTRRKTTQGEDICIFSFKKHLGNAMNKADVLWYRHTETSFEAIPPDRQDYELIDRVSWIRPELSEYP